MKRILLFLLLACSLHVSAQSSNSLSGTVTGKGSSPLAGASIHVLNTNLGVISDGNGKYEITSLETGKYSLEITAIGYATLRVEATISEGTNDLPISLREAYTQLDAVVVTAQKQEEDAQRIASSVSVISSKQVQQYRLWNASEISSIIPNLYSTNPGDNRNVTSIRGITSTSYDPAVATYVDGVNQFGLDTYIPQLFDVERIEVLRGPQGTLYGRNAMGGVINIITKQPTNKTSGFAETTFGNYGLQRHSIGIKTPLIKNKLFFGASAVYDQTDGFYTNDYNGSHFDKKHSLTGNYYLKYLVSPKWAITLNAKNNENRNNGAFTLAGTKDDALNNPFKVNQNATAKMIDNVVNASLTVAHSGHVFNFSSQTTYQSNYRYYNKPLDGDFNPIDGVSIINNYGKKWNTVKVFTQEFKFTSPASTSSPVKWTAGSYSYLQKSPVKQATRFGNDAKYVGVKDDSLFSITNINNSENIGTALYGQISYAFSSKLELILGARADYEHKKTTISAEYQHDPDPTSFPIRNDTSATSSYGAFSPKVAFAYSLSDHNQLYASYNRGFRTGGISQLSSDPSQPPLHAYKPEYSNNLEIGSKNTFFDNRVKANVSIFYIDVTNAQVPTLVLPDAITVIKNTGSLVSKGIDIELSATPVRGLQFDYNFGFTSAKYKSLNYSQNGEAVDLKGKRQIYSPAFTSMLASQYQINAGILKITPRLEWQWYGRQYFDLSNNIQQSPYYLLNARLAFAVKNFELSFWGRNLADSKYIAYAYDFGATRLGNPKTYGATFRVSF